MKYSPIILRPALPAITLDEAVLEVLETFYNGCNYSILFEENGDAYLDWGCYGVYVNIAQGSKRLLLEWFCNGKYDDHKKYLPKLLPISEEIKIELMKRKPCERCGAPFFKYNI